MIVFYRILLKNGELREFYETSYRLRGSQNDPFIWALCLNPEDLNYECHDPYSMQDVESLQVKAVYSGWEQMMGDSLVSQKDTEYTRLPREWEEIAETAFSVNLVKEDGIFKLTTSKQHEKCGTQERKFDYKDKPQTAVITVHYKDDALISPAYPGIYEFAKRVASMQKLELEAEKPHIEYEESQVRDALRPGDQLYPFLTASTVLNANGGNPPKLTTLATSIVSDNECNTEAIAKHLQDDVADSKVRPCVIL